jgi:hypothetical protein
MIGWRRRCAGNRPVTPVAVNRDHITLLSERLAAALKSAARGG